MIARSSTSSWSTSVSVMGAAVPTLMSAAASPPASTRKGALEPMPRPLGWSDGGLRPGEARPQEKFVTYPTRTEVTMDSREDAS